MIVRDINDLSPAQVAVLKEVPTQGRAWDKLSKIATAAEELLADKHVGRDGFSTGLIIDRVNEMYRAEGSRESLSAGGMYRYISSITDLIEFVWWWRQKFWSPQPVAPATIPSAKEYDSGSELPDKLLQ